MKYFSSIIACCLLLFVVACKTDNSATDTEKTAETDTEFEWQVDRFADIRVLRYQIPGFDELSLKQKKLVYYLTEAGLCGRDMMYDINYRHNLKIRRAFEKIMSNYKGDKSSNEWSSLSSYAKRIWFANGIHHHYSNNKFEPGFTQEYFESILKESNASLDGEALKAMFDPEFDAKKVSLDADEDLVKNSAVNFYAPDVTQKDVEDYYAKLIDTNDETPISYGLNTKVVKTLDGSITEKVWHENGMYGSAIKQMNNWLRKAMEVTENAKQKKALALLIEYYQTGDLEKWDEYNIEWASTKEGDVDYITGFVEVYNDPMGYKGSYETIVQIKDFEASKRMQIVAENAQWFEDNSPILDKHKKKNVVGVSYNVVAVAGESGDASPSTPIGVNLPNSNWIRETGSKSVSLGNIIDAYDKASGPGMLQEFANDEEEVARAQKHGELADKLATALHEVIGHASGQIEPGVGTPKETMKSYASTIEEARADIVALYYLMDPKLVELGLIPSLEVGRTEYDGFISNGMLKQLRRLEMGDQVEESHMRNRQLISNWAFEKGQKDGVISRLYKDGNIYYNINDYEKLRGIFGALLTELQRMTSEGDYDAARNLVENYGVKVDPKVHQQVLDRTKKLNIAPYSGFINPELEPVTNSDGEITDIKVIYPTDFVAQMLKYGEKYSFLPDEN